MSSVSLEIKYAEKGNRNVVRKVLFLTTFPETEKPVSRYSDQKGGRKVKISGIPERWWKNHLSHHLSRTTQKCHFSELHWKGDAKGVYSFCVIGSKTIDRCILFNNYIQLLGLIMKDVISITMLICSNTIAFRHLYIFNLI